MNGDQNQKQKKQENIIGRIVNYFKENITSDSSFDFDDKKRKKNKHNPDILEVNLIQDEIIIHFDWRKSITNLIIWVILAWFFVGGIYGSIVWWEKRKTTSIDYFVEAFNDLNIKIKKTELRAEDALLFKKKLALVNKVLASHIYWTNFFQFLETNTLPDIAYSNFSGDTAGKYQLSSMSKDFNAIANQVSAILSDPYTNRADVDSARIIKSEDGNAAISAIFNLNLEVNPEIFADYDPANK